jgi:hypothetical protein
VSVLQAVLTWLAVAAAAAWVVWTILLPRRVRRALGTRLTRRRAPAASEDCGCGGGCHD